MPFFKRIEPYVFFFVIASSVVQTGKHFWPSFSFIDGVRIDYLSPTLYLSDIAIFLLFVTVLVVGKQYIISKKTLLLIFSFLFVVVISIGISQMPQVGFYKLFKLLEFLFLGWYASIFPYTRYKKQLIVLVACLTFFISCVAIGEFYFQHSIGGIVWFLGERTFTASTPGIALAQINGKILLRPYATFPHPNVLAGYLLVYLTLLLFVFSTIKNSTRPFLLGCIIVGIIALCLTLSRISLVLFSLLFFSWVFITQPSLFRSVKFGFMVILAVFVFVWSPLLSRFASVFSTDTEPAAIRTELLHFGISQYFTHPLFGVGLGESMYYLPSYLSQTIFTRRLLYLQPIHNIYLLLLVEIGTLGFLFVLYSLFVLTRSVLLPAVLGVRNFRSLNVKNHFSFAFSLITICLLIIGLLDHYFLTLQQGMILLSFVIGATIAVKNG